MPSFKTTLDSLCPPFLRSHKTRIEASPLGYRLAKGAFWSLAGSLIARGLGLLSAIFVGRMLGKHGYGELGIIQSTIGMFGTLAGFGMGLTANKYVAEFKSSDPIRAGRIIGLTSATAWISSGIMAVVLIAYAPWLAAKTLAAPQLSGLLQIGALLLLLSGVNGAQLGALSGFESFKRIAQINLISGLLTFPLMVVGAWKWGVTGAVCGLIGSQLANCVMSFLAIRVESARYQISHHYVGCLSELRLFWSFSVPTVLIGVLNAVVIWGAGALVVNQIGGYGDMGIYNAASRVASIPNAILGMLIAPIIPMLSESFCKSDHSAYQKTFRASVLISTLAIVPVSLIQVAAPALTLIPFGSEYQGRPLVVSWLMLYSIISCFCLCLNNALIAAGRAWLIWLLSLSFAVSYGALAVFLVPRYGGVGYAASSAIAFGVQTILSAAVLYHSYPEIICQACWGGLTLLSLSLFSICFLGSFILPFRWAVGLGMLLALLFGVIVVNGFRGIYFRIEKGSRMSNQNGNSTGTDV
jgi:O-antigen/teichoic acid export membrane protein